MLYKYIMVHVNGHYVNPNDSHLALFGSTNTSRTYGISGATNNSLAANASRIKGGFKKKRRITKRKSSKRKRTKRRKYKGGCQKCATCGLKGGSCQSCSNIQRGGLHSVTHFNNGYSTGGDLLSSELALANPVPYYPHSNFTNPYYPNERLSY
jgi:fructose-1,6-bisphosphatase/sedoheptulose 1,7-bisphosphatase-like protein